MSSPSTPPCELFSHLNEFRLQNKFHDVVIKVEDRTFYCHRIILASVFEYFQNMFCKNFVEANKEEVELKGILADDFELLLTHVYGGLVNFGGENVYRLLRMAHYLSLQTLEDNCVKYLLDKGDEITLDNAICIFTFASKIGKNILLEKFAGHMAKNFESVSKSEKFYRVAASDLLRVLKHSDLIKNSAVILSFLEEWVQFQSDQDKNLLPELLDAVDPKEIPKEWFVRALTMRNNPSLSSTSKITNKNADNDEEQNSLITGETLFMEGREDEVQISPPRSEIKLPFIMYTLEYLNSNVGDPSISLYQLDSCNKVWPMNIVFDKGSMCIYGSKFIQFCKSISINNIHYFTVMLEGSRGKNHMQYYHYSSFICNKLKQKKRLPVFDYQSVGDVLNTLTITECASNIYLYTGGKLIMLNCQTHEWNELCTDKLEKIAFPNLVSHNDNLYLIGGKRRPIEVPKSVDLIQYHMATSGRLFQHFDPRTGQISHMPKLRYARSKSASISITTLCM